jgi:hypothetical protein
MNVGIQGTKEFSDYNVFLRAMGVALSDVVDGEFNVYTAGPSQINSFTAEFCNRSENSLKNRGIRVRYYRVPPSFIEENAESFDYFAFLSTPNQKPSKLTGFMELTGVETGIFRY